MASQMMQTIAETERLCDEKKQAAKQKAADILEEAGRRVEAMRSDEATFVRDKEKTILAEAEKKAELMIADGEEDNRRKRQALFDETAEKRQTAVRQTALYLLELAQRGS